MAEKGENLRDLPQFLDVDHAQKIVNYLITGEGGLKMRRGYTQVATTTGTDGMRALDYWTTNLIVVGWAQKVGVVDIAAKTLTEVKTDFNASGQFDGDRYGDYFHVASPEDKIGQMSFTLDYDAQSANFTVGAKLTGGTSGATAIILEDSDGGATGTLTLGQITGTFENNETITDDNGTPGSATVDGTLSYTYTELSNAPKAVKIKSVGARLFASLASDRSQIKYCDVDTGTNPPFQTWNNSATATHGGLISFRNAGPINDIDSLDKVILVAADYGTWAFHIEVLDVGGTLEKVESTDMYRVEAGGSKKLKVTDTGIYSVNKRGLSQIVGIGQSDIPFSKQEAFVSKSLGNKYFDDINLDDADIVEYKKENTLLIFCRNNSATNNYVICYNTDRKAFSRITGWNMNGIINIDGQLYGGASNANTIFKLFDGWTDGGTKIWTDFEQEVPAGNLTSMEDLEQEYCQGFLSANTILNMRFSRMDRRGKLTRDVLKLQWASDIKASVSDGYGDGAFGYSGYGGDSDLAGTVENFAGFGGKLRNFRRLKVRFSGQHNAPHQINWFSIETREKQQAKKRNLTNVT